VTCLTMSDRLQQYMDSELPPAERAEVDAHLAGCAACREASASLERLGALLRRELADPRAAFATAGLWRAIEARLDPPVEGRAGAPDGARALSGPEASGWSRASSRRRPRSLLAAAAAAAALAIAVPLAVRWFATPADEAAEVASVESGEEASVVLLTGDSSQAPIIWVTEIAPAGDDGSPL
jgi:anti-sigma factor RsiW